MIPQTNFQLDPRTVFYMINELKAILTQPSDRNAFKAFLKERGCTRYLQFWLDVEILKNEGLTQDHQVAEKAIELCDNYIASESPYSLQVFPKHNQNDVLRDWMIFQIEAQEDQKINRAIFDQLQNTVAVKLINIAMLDGFNAYAGYWLKCNQQAKRSILRKPSVRIINVELKEESVDTE